MTGKLRARRRLQQPGLRPTGGAFAGMRAELVERYRCTACKGSRLELVAGALMGPYYRFCRRCGGTGVSANAGRQRPELEELHNGGQDATDETKKGRSGG